jgi:hypothetical protein
MNEFNPLVDENQSLGDPSLILYGLQGLLGAGNDVEMNQMRCYNFNLKYYVYFFAMSVGFL